MADDRPADDDVAALAKLRSDLDDLRSTLLARAGRMPTGTIEPTLLPVAKPDCLFLQGSSVGRADYPALWQWANDNGLVGTGPGQWFDPGPTGSTTFKLPDFTGRVLFGANASNPLAKKFGTLTDSVTLALANMPQHSHTGSATTDNPGNHDHGALGTGNQGAHDGHNDRTGTSQGASPPTPNLVDYGIRNWGDHRHTLEWEGGHTHAVTLKIDNAGSANPTPIVVDTVQPSIAINFMIWT